MRIILNVCELIQAQNKVRHESAWGVTLAYVFLLPKQFACVLNPFLINKHLHTAHWFIKRLFSELRAFG